MKIKEVIVVEGRDDTAKIKQAVEAETIETNGSAINEDILLQIRHAKKKRGVIIFTDPDYPGERIRRIIDEKVPGCKHAFLTQDEARAKNPQRKSLGIEHASVEAIRRALKDVYQVMEEEKSVIAKEDLLAFGLIGRDNSGFLRKRLGEILQIGHTNGKQLLKRLNLFQITKMELQEAMEQMKQEEENGSLYCDTDPNKGNFK